jgi:hypothetical protein
MDYSNDILEACIKKNKASIMDAINTYRIYYSDDQSDCNTEVMKSVIRDINRFIRTGEELQDEFTAVLFTLCEAFAGIPENRTVGTFHDLQEACARFAEYAASNNLQ